jgi:type IV secretion system protein VirB11
MNTALDLRAKTTTRSRLIEGLRKSLGTTVAELLADDSVVEIMANPDGSLWLDRLGTKSEPGGRVCVGSMLPQQVESVIRFIATSMGQSATPENPMIAGTLPESGERFQGLLPPIVAQPTFTIRKRPRSIFALDDYVARGMLSDQGAATLRQALAERENILVAGGTGSGKTTLVNALLAEPAFATDRVVLIEDTRELQCSAKDCVPLLTKPTEPRVTMTDLLRHTLRLRPDRIVVGEVRGPEALALLKAWNTGHPGGVGTIHANSAEDALYRLEDLIAEASATVPHRAIASAINLIVFIERVPGAVGRRVSQMVRVEGYAEGVYRLVEGAVLTNGAAGESPG